MSAPPISPFLELEALGQFSNLRFTTRRRLEGPYSGRHASRKQGGAGEFVDYREYAPGEDLRRLDWKVFARTGRPYVRLYQDETMLSAILVLDVTRSMSFSGIDRRPPSKLQVAQYLGTAMSHVIAASQDQVGLAIVGGRLESYLPPGSTPTHLTLLQSRIAEARTHAATQMAPGLAELFRLSSRRIVLLVMSDFLSEDLAQVFTTLRLFRHANCDPIVLHLVHPEEERLPGGRAFRFHDPENATDVTCSPAEFAEEYRQRFAEHATTVRTLAQASGCDYLRVSTAIPYLQTLGEFLVARAG